MAATGFATSMPTSFLPLTTQGPSIGSECASAIYQQANNGYFLGWDPWWVTEVDEALSTCWPKQATLWWDQDDSETTTILGKSFVCPYEYHEVFTSSIDAHTTQTICCPTSYSLYIVGFDRPSFPSQCISTLADGETLSYRTVSNLDTGGSVNWATSGTLDEVLTIFGIPVNGLNVYTSESTSVATSTTSGTVTTSTGAAGEVVTVTASADTSSAQSSNSSSSSGQHSIVGVAVGASVGAVVGIILLAAVGFVVWRRKRRQLGRSVPAATHELDTPLEVHGKTSTSPVGPPDIPKPATELDSSRYYEAYELPADTRGGRG